MRRVCIQSHQSWMHLLKRTCRADGAIMGDIVPLVQLRTLVDLVLRFEKQTNRQLAKETVLEYSTEFWLNKYFEKELTLLCHSDWMNIVLTH